MLYTVTAYMPQNIKLAPETTTEEILQNIQIIISSPKFSVPLERGLGLTTKFLDAPTERAKAIFQAEIFEAIEKFEPRAKIKNISFVESKNEGLGKLVPVLEVDIN